MALCAAWIRLRGNYGALIAKGAARERRSGFPPRGNDGKGGRFPLSRAGCRLCKGRWEERGVALARRSWIPAFAGMTAEGVVPAFAVRLRV